MASESPSPQRIAEIVAADTTMDFKIQQIRKWIDESYNRGYDNGWGDGISQVEPY